MTHAWLRAVTLVTTAGVGFVLGVVAGAVLGFAAGLAAWASLFD